MARFTPGELAVMQLLWEHGELKPADLQKRFPWLIKNPALRSHLSILLAKGHVKRRKMGKAYFYQAVTRQTSAFRSTLRDLVDNYCGGSVQALLLNLIQTEKLTSAELLELEKLAKGQSPEPDSPKRKQS
jgi:BlaI family transcriptional regulator, penicillinase repressor